MPTKPPVISVIIVNWNTESLLPPCINSLKTHIKKYSFEIILVDNASSDNSVAIVKDRFPDVLLIENNRNRGFGRAVNQGIEIASGRYLVLFNTDASVEDGAIDQLISYMETHPQTGICGGQLIYPDGRKQHSFDNYPSLATELLNKSLLKRLFPEKYPSKKIAYAQPLPVDSIIGACMAVRAECIRKIGRLDEDYFFFLEETDWCYRIKQAGYDIMHIPSARIVHLQGKSAGKVPVRSRLEYYRSRYLFFRKNRGLLPASALFIALFAKCMINSIFYILLAVLTCFANNKIRYRLILSLMLVAAHICMFPAKMRLEGNA
ncbi:MAG: glycosyltransferase family 2 protein [Candidatus Auribacterota bacterium]